MIPNALFTSVTNHRETYVQPHEQKASPLTLKPLKPTATVFTNKIQEYAYYYFNNNVWKPSALQPHKKCYRYCIACGKNRFTDQQWSKIRDCQSLACRKESCQNAFFRMPIFVPCEFFMIGTAEDIQTLHDNPPSTSFTGDVREVTSSADIDRNDVDGIPPRYLKMLASLENLSDQKKKLKINEIVQYYQDEIYDGNPNIKDDFLNLLEKHLDSLELQTQEPELKKRKAD